METFRPHNQPGKPVLTDNRIGSVLMSIHFIRPADLSDVRLITECVRSAYEHYIPLLGMKPNPMLDDYSKVIAKSQVWVLMVSDNLAGVLVLDITEEGFFISDIALHPGLQGKGFGSFLLTFAEEQATRSGYRNIYLYTNVAMTENPAIYAARGFVEYARRDVNGRQGVFMEKRQDYPAD